MARRKSSKNEKPQEVIADATEVETPVEVSADAVAEPVEEVAEPVIEAPAAEEAQAEDATSSCPLRSMAGFAAVKVSAPSVTWISMLYKDGFSGCAERFTRYAFVDEAGVLHVFVGVVEDNQVIANMSKHFQLTNWNSVYAETMPMTSGRNWVTSGMDVDLVHVGDEVAVRFSGLDKKGNHVADTYPVTFLS